MSNGYIESSLKRFLKRKVKVTLGLVVAFMITGTVGFAEELIEGSEEWHREQAIKYLEGYSSTENKFNPVSDGKFTITENGEISITGLWDGTGTVSSSELVNKPNLFKANVDSASKLIDKVYNENNVEISNVENDLQIDGKSNYQYGMELKNSDTVNVIYGSNENQPAEEGVNILVNHGAITFAGPKGQYIFVKGGKVFNYGIIANSGAQGQHASGEKSEIYNYGVIQNKNTAGQNIEGTGSKAYNYGLIANNGENGQETYSKDVALYNYGIIANKGAGQTIEKTGAESSKAYNYGLIISSGTGQSAVTAANSLNGSKNNELINYGIIQSGTKGQDLSAENSKAYNYGIIQNLSTYGQNIASKNSKGYNYGIIQNTGMYGQVASGETAEIYNYGIIANKNASGQYVNGKGTAYNFGIIENSGNNGQHVYNVQGGTVYNFGIIRNSGDNAISAAAKDNTITSAGYNYGIVDFRENETLSIFNGNVENKGLVLTNSNVSQLKLGNGKNYGVVLDNSLELKNTGADEINGHVVKIENGYIIGQEGIKDAGGTLQNANSPKDGITTGYIKDGSATITENLEDKILTAVVTENSNLDTPVFTYDGGAVDKKTLVLTDTTVMGYFEKNGTLLDVTNGDLLLAGDSVINAVKKDGTLDVATVNIGKDYTLSLAGDKATVTGKVTGGGKMALIASGAQNLEAALDEIVLKNAVTQDEIAAIGGAEKNITDAAYNNLIANKVTLSFTDTYNDGVNKIDLGEDSVIGKKDSEEIKTVIDGSGSEDKMEISIGSIANVHGNVVLGGNDDVFNGGTTGERNPEYVIDGGAGNDKLALENIAAGGTYTKTAGNTYDLRTKDMEEISLGKGSWFVGDNAKISGAEGDYALNSDGQIFAEMNNKDGKFTTSLDNIADNGVNLTVDAKDGLKYIIGNDFKVSDKVLQVENGYNVSDDTEVTAASIYSVSEDGKTLTLRTAQDLGIGHMESMYNAILNGIENPDNGLKDLVNGDNSEAKNLKEFMNHTTRNIEAYYTAGYIVTKNIADSFTSSIEEFTKKAGKGEWLAQGKYINSDTEFDGGNKVKGYDGDIDSAVAMVEYGVSDTTSYGVAFGGGDTEVEIQDGGDLSGDNYYVGAYMKHRTVGGIDLVGSVGFVKSDLDSTLKNSFGIKVGDTAFNGETYADGSADSDAVIVSLKGKKDYRISDSVILQPVLGARYTLVKQDTAKNPAMGFEVSAQDVTIVEGTAGLNLVKEFNLNSGKLGLFTGAEYTLSNASKYDDIKYSLFGTENLELENVEMADNKGTFHVGADYEHENGVGFNAKYEMMWSDEGDDSRITAGISYRF